MRLRLTSIRKTYFLYVIPALLCLIFISVGVTSRSKRNQDFQPRIINKTNGLQVISARKSTTQSIPTLEITLLNDSPKSIMAYTLLLGDGGLTTDYAFSEKLLAPGESEIKDIPLAGLELNAAKKHSLTLDVVISAVYFEDRSGEGDHEYLSMLKDKYVGVRDQTQRVLAILRKAIVSPLYNTEQMLSELESQASLLKTENENTSLSLDGRSGRNLVNENLKKVIQMLESRRSTANVTDFKVEIQKFIAAYEKLLARL